jgi:predicted lactoylglutathione lyase
MVKMKLEALVLPTSDVDRAKRLYQSPGFRENIDYVASFQDPDGNVWVPQEVKKRAPGRLTFAPFGLSPESRKRS